MKTEINEQEVIMYDDPRAARQVIITDGENKITGWVSRLNHYYGKDEHMARYDGSTHKLCKCGNKMEKTYSLCPACREKERNERYWKLPLKEWDGKTMLTLWDGEEFFNDYDEVAIYCEDNNINIEDLQLVICQPLYLRELNYDYWDDVWPEDWEPPIKLKQLVDALNEYCRNSLPVSWEAGKFRTSLKTETE